MARPIMVAGIDLSLTGCGLVAVPADWGLEWRSIAHRTFGRGLAKDAPFWEQIRRLDDVTEDVVRWVEVQGCTHAYVEQYPVGAGGGPYNIDKLAELGGAVKVQLARELRLFCCPIAISTARSTACGRMPKLGKGRTKPYVHGILKSIGLPDDWTGDEADAWVVANQGLLMMGCCAVVAPRDASPGKAGAPAAYRKPNSPTRNIEELIR